MAETPGLIQRSQFFENYRWPQIAPGYAALGLWFFQPESNRKKLRREGLAIDYDRSKKRYVAYRAVPTKHGAAKSVLHDLGQNDFALGSAIPKPEPARSNIAAVDRLNVFLFGDGQIISGMKRIIRPCKMPKIEEPDTFKNFITAVVADYLQEGDVPFPIEATPTSEQLKQFKIGMLGILGVTHGEA